MTNVNVGISERWLSTLVGGMLALGGLERRSAAGALVAGLGGLLIARGVTGYCPVTEQLGAGSGLAGGLIDDEDNVVDEASDESFPASDAPSWTATSSVGSPHDNRR